MKNRGLVSFVVSMAILALPFTAAAMEHMPKAEAEPFWTYITETSPYTSWPMWPGKDGIYPGQSPHGAYLKLYVNKPALEALKKDEPMPEGAIIVKENYGKDQKTLKAITPMYLKKGYNPDGGDWFWAKYGGKGEVMAAGKVDSCIKCHKVQKDWLFTEK